MADQADAAPPPRDLSFRDVDVYGRGTDAVFGAGAEARTAYDAKRALTAVLQNKMASPSTAYIDYDLYGRGDPRIFGHRAHVKNAGQAARALDATSRRSENAMRDLMFPSHARPLVRLGMSRLVKGSIRLVRKISMREASDVSRDVEAEHAAQRHDDTPRRVTSKLPHEEAAPKVETGAVLRGISSFGSQSDVDEYVKSGGAPLDAGVLDAGTVFASSSSGVSAAGMSGSSSEESTGANRVGEMEIALADTRAETGAHEDRNLPMIAEDSFVQNFSSSSDEAGLSGESSSIVAEESESSGYFLKESGSESRSMESSDGFTAASSESATISASNKVSSSEAMDTSTEEDESQLADRPEGLVMAAAGHIARQSSSSEAMEASSDEDSSLNVGEEVESQLGDDLMHSLDSSSSDVMGSSSGEKDSESSSQVAESDESRGEIQAQTGERTIAKEEPVLDSHSTQVYDRSLLLTTVREPSQLAKSDVDNDAMETSSGENASDSSAQLDENDDGQGELTQMSERIVAKEVPIVESRDTQEDDHSESLTGAPKPLQLEENEKDVVMDMTSPTTPDADNLIGRQSSSEAAMSSSDAAMSSSEAALSSSEDAFSSSGGMSSSRQDSEREKSDHSFNEGFGRQESIPGPKESIVVQDSFMRDYGLAEFHAEDSWIKKKPSLEANDARDPSKSILAHGESSTGGKEIIVEQTDGDKSDLGGSDRDTSNQNYFKESEIERAESEIPAFAQKPRKWQMNPQKTANVLPMPSITDDNYSKGNEFTNALSDPPEFASEPSNADKGLQDVPRQIEREVSEVPELNKFASASSDPPAFASEPSNGEKVLQAVPQQIEREFLGIPAPNVEVRETMVLPTPQESSTFKGIDAKLEKSQVLGVQPSESENVLVATNAPSSEGPPSSDEHMSSDDQDISSAVNSSGTYSPSSGSQMDGNSTSEVEDEEDAESEMDLSGYQTAEEEEEGILKLRASAAKDDVDEIKASDTVAADNNDSDDTIEESETVDEGFRGDDEESSVALSSSEAMEESSEAMEDSSESMESSDAVEESSDAMEESSEATVSSSEVGLEDSDEYDHITDDSFQNTTEPDMRNALGEQ